jgi:AcrR family transcriptional regulator
VATAPVETFTRSQLARRARVIEAAMRLAGDGGYDAVQMRDVATEANVALGTIYRYFASKDHLLAACQVEWSKEIRERLAQRPPQGDTTSERVIDVVRRASRAIERQPTLAAALVTAISSPDPAVADCQRASAEVVAAVLSAGLDGIDPERRDGIVGVLSHVWFAVLLGWVNGWTGVGAVGDELEKAARLLLPE